MMKKKLIILLLAALVFSLLATSSGCALFSKVPEEYTEGIKLNRDFPDDIIEIYDDAIIFKEDERFDEIVISCGSTDDIDDIVDFYRDFFEDEEIVLDTEIEDRDEYYAKFQSEGYIIKLEVVEADDEYIDDLFEYVIHLSAKKTDDVAISNTSPSPTPAATQQETPAPTPTENKQDYNDSHLPYGSWTLIMTEGIDGLYATDFNFEVYDETNGTMYYSNPYAETQWVHDFTYTFVDDTLTFFLTNGTNLIYTANYYSNTLELVNQSNTAIHHTFMNWNEEYQIRHSDDKFTAYGNWIFYDPDINLIETISFWPSGIGFAYDWAVPDANEPFSWSYANTEITLYHDNGDVQTYKLYHKGNIIELITDSNTYVLNRISSNWLSGYYAMYDSEDVSVVEWELGIGSDNSLYYYALYSDDETYTYTDLTWYINPSDGRFNMDFNDGYEYGFDYHYSPLSLIVVDPEVDYYYYLGKAG